MNSRRAPAILPMRPGSAPIHPEDRAGVARAWLDAAAAGREVQLEWRTVPRDGACRWLMARGGPVFAPDGAVESYLGVVIDITQRKQTEERIRFLAHHDTLTGLPNRMAFNEGLAEALGGPNPKLNTVAILCLDLDRFKEVNDVYGHGAGDELLRRIGDKFRAAGPDVRIARVGGDEFMAAIGGDNLAERALSLAQRLRDDLAEPVLIDGKSIRVGLSVGISLYPEHGDIAAVLANADVALYRAKTTPGGDIRLFDAELDHRLRERHALLQDLQHALEREQLLLHYQPQIGMDGVVFGFEALLRWRHPERGFVSPEVFISVAEEGGLIDEIGAWVLREACREAAGWRRPLVVAVNLSPTQFRKPGLPALVEATLRETGLPAGRLELEVTEGVLVDDFERATLLLRELKALGVKVAMDDFGVGYSSLSYLQSFPFDKIKIDRSFVSSLLTNPNSATIIRAIIGLGRGLGVPLIAEGVETEEQLAFLRDEGCAQAQGYLIGAPRPIGDYAATVGLAALETAGGARARLRA